MGCGSSTPDKKRAPGAKPPKAAASRNGAQAKGPQNQSKQGARATSKASLASKESEGAQTKESRVRRDILRGTMDIECPSNAKVVRIFTSSTFTDSSTERNALMSRVYPKLKSFCQESGYEFQIVDMRWGVRDEATDNHMTSELCLREVKHCQRLSTGPNFVTFLSHKYGYRAFPNNIEATEFEKVLSKITNDEDKAIISKWIKRDDNAVPPCYTLLPISTHLPGFISDEEDKRAEAKNTWYEESSRVKETFIKAAETVLNAKEMNKYIVSVTEAEIECGILSADDVNKHCVWFQRVISHIGQKETTPILAKFIDCSQSESEQTQKRDLLKKLAENKIPAVLDKKKIQRYEINWTDDGINPAVEEEHRKYIDSLCEDFQSIVTAMISEGIEERNKHELTDDLYEEVLQHTLFAQTKCRSFHGRETMLESIKSYALGSSRVPLVIHGQSGSGKTSVMAKAAQMTKSWIQNTGKCIVLLRFLGTTPGSTSITALLTSLVNQLMVIVKEKFTVPKDLKDLVTLFAKMLGALPSSVHTIIYLDSLDQLDPSHGARQLSWLPRHLPSMVKIVVSTLPEPIYECFPRLQAMVKDNNQFVEVERLPDKDVSSILDSWLALENRTLTVEQKTAVLEAFKQCPIPLYLKLSFDTACRWRSYDTPDKTILETTVRAAINSLFDRVERLHGQLFVSRALALLTLSVNGLTESELEDILSCDEEVLNDVYQYWLPSVRRLPPLLLVRMKADLGEYMVDRGADGVRVFYWYHRQFIETATDRYCSDPEVNTKVHILLAEFFRGTWSGVTKPYTDKTGSEGEADRFVAAQPLQFGTTPNLRKLKNLPRHLIQGNLQDVLKKDVCLNMEFLLAKLNAVSLRSVLDDFEEAGKVFSNDEDISMVLDSLRLSQDALVYDPNELPCQLIGRIPAEKENIFGDLTDLSIQYLMPDNKILTTPGGQLIHCLAGHREYINCVDITSDGKIAVTASVDRSVRFWNVKEGKLIQTLENMVEDPERLQICSQDKIAVVNSNKRIIGLRVPSGDTVYTIDNFHESNSEMNFIGTGQNLNKLIILGEKTVYMYDAVTGKKLSEIHNPAAMGDETFTAYDPISAIGRYVATAVSGSAVMRVVDLQKGEFIHNKRMFPTPKTEDDDELTIDGLAITPDKKNIIFSNLMDTDVHICHLKTMAKLKVFKGKKSDNSENFRISLDGSTLFFPNYLSIAFVDLKTGERTNHAKHPNNLVAVATVNMVNVVTVSNDSIVRIWDLSRDDPSAQTKLSIQDKQKRPKSGKKHQHSKEIEKDDSSVEKEEIFSFQQIEAMENPRYVFVRNRRNEVQIYDLVKKKNVRCAKQPSVVTFTKNGKDLKIYNLDTGLVDQIIKTEQVKPLEELLISTSGKWLTVLVEDGPLLILNMETRKVEHTLPRTEIGEFTALSESRFTPCDTYLLLSTSAPYLGEKDIDEYHYKVIDSVTGKAVQHLFDVEYHKIYQKTEVDYGVTIGCSEYLRDFLFLVGSDDKIIRVWNVQTGELLHRLTGHSHDVSTIIAQKDGTRFVSHSNYTEEEAFRLWDGLNFTCLASFKGDHDIERINFSRDGSLVVAGDIPTKSLVSWRLTGAGTTEKVPSGEEEYEGESTALIFTALGESTYSEADPDTEEPDPSSDEDEENLAEDKLSLDDFTLSDTDEETDRDFYH